MKTERRWWVGLLLGVAAVGCTQLSGLDQNYHLVESSGTVGMLGRSCLHTGQLACAGHAQKSKLICGSDGTWATNGTCDGDTRCDTTAGFEQGTCKPTVSGCAGKQAADVVCEGTKRVRCGPDLVTTEDVEMCSGACVLGKCLMPPSCVALPATCGPGRNEFCCAVASVPGGSYNRINDPSFPATVSGFLLDRFEVTAGRFRNFVAAYPSSKPKAGDGAHPLIANSGWKPAWDVNLPADRQTLMSWNDSSPSCQMSATWNDALAANVNLPANCISWYLAMAFCAWDGGRLPTDAEWNYAAAGGNEQRPYPWGTTEIDSRYAVFDCLADGVPAPSCTRTWILQVGSKPKGNGKWGHADLAGSMWEWSLDAYEDRYSATCSNCANLTDDPYRMLRGGSFLDGSSQLRSSARIKFSTTESTINIGIRCARTP
jgi:formylglycine-generating enzyme